MANPYQNLNNKYVAITVGGAPQETMLGKLHLIEGGVELNPVYSQKDTALILLEYMGLLIDGDTTNFGGGNDSSNGLDQLKDRLKRSPKKITIPLENIVSISSFQ